MQPYFSLSEELRYSSLIVTSARPDDAAGFFMPVGSLSAAHRHHSPEPETLAPRSLQALALQVPVAAADRRTRPLAQVLPTSGLGMALLLFASAELWYMGGRPLQPWVCIRTPTFVVGVYCIVQESVSPR